MSTTTNSIGLMVSVVLVVVSEVMLFVSILWSVVLFLVAHSVYTTGSTASIVSVSSGLGTSDVTTMYANTLTLLNTNLLLASGVVSIAAIHAVSMKTPVIGTTMMLVVSMLGTVFLVVQCCEYIHLYWCMYSSGVAGMLYVTTGIHGGHVLVGMVLILLCTIQ